MSLVERAVERMKKAAASAGGAPDAAAKEPQGAAATATVEQVPRTQSTRRLLIDMKALRERGYLPQDNRDRAFADHYRQIKRPLITHATATTNAVPSGVGDPRVIMMTSALPGDGKTFSSINLALSIARERDVSVLLIDADIAKSHISDIFGLREAPGLTDALLDESIAAESLVIPTDVRGLSVLPAGRPAEGITELLSSERMRQVLASLTKYSARRLLLLDSAPLLITSEARALAELVGQVVIVVRTGETPRRAMQDALKLIDEQRAGGIILNEARVGVGAGYYGYGYGYGASGAVRDDSSPSG